MVMNLSILMYIYTHQGETLSIDTCEVQKLYEIDGDMSAQGV